jgi:hypothetical protein
MPLGGLCWFWAPLGRCGRFWRFDAGEFWGMVGNGRTFVGGGGDCLLGLWVYIIYYKSLFGGVIDKLSHNTLKYGFVKYGVMENHQFFTAFII